jgi:hypothetical protein
MKDEKLGLPPSSALRCSSILAAARICVPSVVLSNYWPPDNALEPQITRPKISQNWTGIL